MIIYVTLFNCHDGHFNRHVMLKQLRLVMTLQWPGQILAVCTMPRERSGWPFIILKRFTSLASLLFMLKLVSFVRLYNLTQHFLMPTSTWAMC